MREKKKKRKMELDEDDLDEIAEDAKLLKKFKKGKVSSSCCGIGLATVLDSRASGRLFDTQTLKNHPSGLLNLFQNLLKKSLFHAYHYFYSLPYNSHNII